MCIGPQRLGTLALPAAHESTVCCGPAAGLSPGPSAIPDAGSRAAVCDAGIGTAQLIPVA